VAVSEEAWEIHEMIGMKLRMLLEARVYLSVQSTTEKGEKQNKKTKLIHPTVPLTDPNCRNLLFQRMVGS
jgi:cytochrome b561